MEKYTAAEIKEMARLQKNKYQREWKRNNPDKVKAYQEKHYFNKYLEELEEQKEA